MSKALDDIAAERQRQIDVEGWTPEHDDEHFPGEIALAAAAYAINSFPGGSFIDDIVQRLWPWDSKWWKPKDKRTDLVRAGALIAAEIERMDRIAARRSATV